MTLHDVYYHTKPYLLMGGGLIVAYVGSNPVLITGGIILLLSGALIWRMRSNSG